MCLRGVHPPPACVPPPPCLPQGVAKRAYMGFPEPPSEAQALAWERVLAFFEENLKAK